MGRAGNMKTGNYGYLAAAITIVALGMSAFSAAVNQPLGTESVNAEITKLIR